MRWINKEKGYVKENGYCFYFLCMYQIKKTDLVAPWQSVHLHQLTLGVKNQLCEGEQLRWKGAFG